MNKEHRPLQRFTVPGSVLIWMLVVADRGVGGVYLVQRGRGGGERGYALAVVTWCAACHEKAGKKEGSNAEEAPYN